jgi:hypothetical protein
MIASQFSNPLNRELAMAELGKLHWHPSSENFNNFHTRVTTLLNRAGIHDWIMHRPLILKVFDDDM